MKGAWQSRMSEDDTKTPAGIDEAKDKRGPETLGVRPFVGRAYLLQDCHVRSDGDGRTVEAYAAAFNVPAEIRDQDGHYNEILTPGSFDKTIAENGTRFGVFYNHAMTLHGTPDGALSVPIGVPLETPRADNHGVHTVTRYLDNPLADSVLDAIKQRAITGQSFTGRFIKSTRTRAETRGGLPTIRRQETAMREYGPTPFPAYAQAHIVGTRSAQAFMADLIALDAQERSELFRNMLALATSLEPTAAEPPREVITVFPPATDLVPEPTVRTESVTPTEEPAEEPATPDEEPATETPATPDGAGDAEEPLVHSARQSEIQRRIRAALIVRKELTNVSS